jgi:hypothetical protein
MNLKQMIATAKEAFLDMAFLPGARAAKAIIAEDPAFAAKLEQAREIVRLDRAMLDGYVPRPLTGAHMGMHAMGPLPPSTFEMLGVKAERQQKIDGGSYKDAFRKAVENTCARGRQLQTESDVRRLHPALFRAPKP